jgi:hypothetical protein
VKGRDRSPGCMGFVAGLFLLVTVGWAADPAPDKTAEEVGRGASIRLMTALKKELRSALSSGGPVKAVEVCSRRAGEIAVEVGRSLGPHVTIGRTSSRFRNPRNAPDPWDRKALHYYEGLHREGSRLPAFLVLRVSNEGRAYDRYYAPIRVRGLCLVCHGKPEKMNPALRKKITAHYPDDRATGYSPGDFRGLVRVSIPVKPGEGGS